MDHEIPVILCLREHATRGDGLRSLLSTIRESAGDDATRVTVIWFLHRAFGLSIGEGKRIVASVGMGGSGDSDYTIDATFLPKIRAYAAAHLRE